MLIGAFLVDSGWLFGGASSWSGLGWRRVVGHVCVWDLFVFKFGPLLLTMVAWQERAKNVLELLQICRALFGSCDNCPPQIM